MNAHVSGKGILVVGGETELGRAVVIGLAEAGANVAIASLTPETQAEFQINSALNELWALDRKGVALAIDASDPDMMRGALEQAKNELGGVDLAVIAGPRTAYDVLDDVDLIRVLDADDAGEALMAIEERLQGG